MSAKTRIKKANEASNMMVTRAYEEVDDGGDDGDDDGEDDGGK